MFQMLGVFAEFEHSIIQERVRAGLYQPAETLTHARMLCVRHASHIPLDGLTFFAMAVSVVARAA
jgi:hypothetical protein